jgi:hypothetical protein
MQAKLGNSPFPVRLSAGNVYRSIGRSQIAKRDNVEASSPRHTSLVEKKRKIIIAKNKYTKIMHVSSPDCLFWNFGTVHLFTFHFK